MTWVQEEHRSLTAALRAADPDAPTLCAGWTARHLCAHLVQRDHASLHNIWDQVTTKSPGHERFMSRMVEDARTPAGYAALVDRFAAGSSPRSLRGRFGEQLNLVEYVVHHEDLRRGQGAVPPRELPPAELDEVWRRSRLFLRRAYRKSPVGVELAPDRGEVQPVRKGPSTVSISGSPVELVLHALGRRTAADIRIDGPPDAVSAFTHWAEGA